MKARTGLLILAAALGASLHAQTVNAKIERDQANLEAMRADVNGPEVRRSITITRPDLEDPFQMTMTVKKSAISFYGAPRLSQREGESVEDYFSRCNHARNIYEVSASAYRTDINAFAAALRKIVEWAQIATANKVQDFEKSFIDAAGKEWTFRYSHGEIRARSTMSTLDLYQVKMILDLLNQLPAADKELAAKTAIVSQQDKLFK